MKLLIIGPQASGKGTQANKIAKKLGIPHLSSGDMLREEKRSGSELGKEIEEMIDRGALVPNEMIWKMIKKRLDAHPEGWILDGFPRRRQQADILDAEYKLDNVILLDVHDEVCLDRISGRRICPVCGKNYHIHFQPPKQEGICDKEGAKLIQRADDNVQAVKKRLATYHEKTKPLAAHYEEILIRVNGDQTIDEVWKELQEKLGI
jgi:adenylate kinase